MSDGQTNPAAEVEKPQLNMFDVMFGSETGKDTNPEQTSEPAQPEAEEVEAAVEVEAQAEPEAEAEELPTEVEEQYEVEEVEATEETKEPSYRVKVGGEEFEVTLDELRNGYQRQSDYTRKSQSLAEQRKTFDANLQAVQAERNQYGKVFGKYFSVPKRGSSKAEPDRLDSFERERSDGIYGEAYRTSGG